MGLMSEAAAQPAVKELVLTRIFDAPRALTFQAWIDPVQITRWWGPKGFTVPHCEIDPRPGGIFRVDMRAPDGVEYPGSGEFHEVIVPERIVYTATAFPDETGRMQLEVKHTITFEEVEGKTRLTLHAQVIRSTPAVAESVAGMEPGW